MQRFRQQRGAADALFTTMIALCAVALSAVFIAAGSAVARLTFTPHSGHSGPAH